jgi:hypothetical protein
MKLMIDGRWGYWRVFVEKTPESGVFEEVNISECSRIEMNADLNQPGASISFVRRELNYIESQPNDHG